jgi:hypothetical protein
MNLTLDPNNKFFRSVQIVSLLYIIYIFILNVYILYDSFDKLAYVIPLSVNKITYLTDVFNDDQDNLFYFRQVNISRFHFADQKEVADFLNDLEYDKSYIISFELTYD